MRFRAVQAAALTLVTALLMLFAGSTPVPAQGTGAIRGQVMEAGTQRPVAGAQVFLTGTTRGTVTDARGNFLIPGVAPGSYEVQVQMIGFGKASQGATVVAEQTVRLDFQLSQAAIELDALVVTGTAGATRQRTLGNTLSSINAAKVAEAAPISNVAQLLTGRTPGLTVMPGSGQVGTAANFRIRGAASLNAANHPAVYIDGVRMRSGSQGGYGTSNHTTRETSALDAINPEDIESIEVIKGPAAATLYGADAAAGVIQIITKKGRTGTQAMSFTARAELGASDWALPMRKNYTLCMNANELPWQGMPTAARIGSASWPGCANLDPSLPWQERLLMEQPLKQDGVLRDGDINRYSLTARGGADRYSFFLSGDKERETGVFSNNWFERKSARMNFSVLPLENVTVDFRVGYTTYTSQQPNNDNASYGWLRNAFRGRPGYNAPWASGWAGLGPEQMALYDNQTENERWILGATAEYKPFTWFRNRLTLGFDAGDRQHTLFYTKDRTGRMPYGSTYANGYIGVYRPATRDYTVDYSGTIDHDFTRLGFSEELTSAFSFGAQYAAQNFHSTEVVGEGLVADPLNLVSSAASTRGYETKEETRSLGFYVQEMVGWKNRLFVTGAVRMDDHSAFGANFSRIFYPKVSVAHVISEEPWFGVPMVDNLKLRLAYGHAGNAPAPFSADRTYEATSAVLADGTVVSALTPGAAGNPDIRAERGEELELGFDAALFDNALGVEFSFYRNVTRDALMTQPVAPSMGYGGSILRNVGEIRNSGLELQVFGSPLKRDWLVWDARMTLSTNRNKLVSFGEMDREYIGVGYRNAQRHVAGYTLGGYWAEDYVYNEDGSLKLLANGRPELTAMKYIGPSAPTREASLTNTFTILRDLQLYTHLDYKGGHYLFNMSEQTSITDLNNQKANDPTISQDEWLKLYYGGNRQFIERADFIKLREVSLRYNLKPEWVQRTGLDGMSLSLAGRNLAMPWTKYSGTDPEVSIAGAETFTRADSNSVPMMRQWVATVDLRF